MSPEEYKESKRVNLPEFEFDEDFDPDFGQELLEETKEKMLLTMKNLKLS